ncbi:MAG: hypothetical protein ABI567_08795 [Gammaproteobacteria bacterium]
MTKKTAPIQGEGDYEAARRYNERTTAFVANAPVAPSAAPQSEAEAQELLQAEREGAGRSRAGGQDRHDAEEMARLEKEAPLHSDDAQR